MRLDTSLESLNMPRSESFADLNSDHLGPTPPSSRIRANFGKNIDADLTSPSKPFGLGTWFYFFAFFGVPFYIVYISLYYISVGFRMNIMFVVTY